MLYSILFQATSSFSWTTLFIIVIVGLGLIALFAERTPEGLSHWHYSFLNTQFSAQELYKRVVSDIKVHEMPNVGFSEEMHLESSIFSGQRKYLRISHSKYVIDVCCSLYGTGCYISWWLGQRDEGIIARIPVIRTIAGKNPARQSYYQLDTALMFKSSVHKILLSIIDEMSEAKGIRKLTELERQPKDFMK